MNQKEWYMKILNWAETDSRLNLRYMDMVVLAEHLANEERGLTKRAVDVWQARQLFIVSVVPHATNANRWADRSEMLFPGEKEAIQTVLALGAKYGYGNLIAHLRRAWALSLKSKYGGTYKQHLPATNSDAYPENLGIE